MNAIHTEGMQSKVVICLETRTVIDNKFFAEATLPFRDKLKCKPNSFVEGVSMRTIK